MVKYSCYINGQAHALVIFVIAKPEPCFFFHIYDLDDHPHDHKDINNNDNSRKAILSHNSRPGGGRD